jgi:hypothetical protein
MWKRRLNSGVALAALAVPAALLSQDKPLTVTGTFATGFYSTTTRGEANQSTRFAPVEARFELSGYYLSPDLISFWAQPQINAGPQASDAGFQGGNGIQFRVTLLRKSIAPLTFRYANVQVEDVYFGSLSQISGYTMQNRNKDLGLTWELKPHGLPASVLDWGTGSVDSKSAAAGLSDYLSESNHFNADTRYERAGWNLEGFYHRNHQSSDLSAPDGSGTVTGALRETSMQYQGSARRGFFGDSELYLSAGSQFTNSLLFTLPIDLNTRYANAGVRLMQRRRWKASVRATYSSNIASQLLEQAATSLRGPGTIVPDGNVLVPFTTGMANLNLNAITSYALGHGLGFYGSAERSEILGGPNSALNSEYFTTSGGVTYTGKFHWGSLSGEYAREFGAGSLIGESGTIQGQHYVVSAQHGGGATVIDLSVHGSDQSIHTDQPLSNRSLSAETSVSERVAGRFNARLGGGWQWSSIVNDANEFRTDGYTARAGIDHPRLQLSAALNDSVSNSLPFYDQLLSGLGLAAITVVPLRPIPSDYRSMSFTLHSNPRRKIEISAAWTRSTQHLDGSLTNNFELLNAFATYHFRRIQVEAGFIRSNQVFLFYPHTMRQRYYVRVVRNARIL